MTIERVNIIDRAIEVHFGDGKSIRFEDCWLRDNCRCPSCYDAATYQRVPHILQIPDAAIKSVQHNKSKVFITWSDNHESSYSQTFLSKYDYGKWMEGRRRKYIFWRGDMSSRIPKVQVEEFLQTTDGAKKVFQSLLDYGVALIEGVEASLDATEVVCKALGGVQHTFYGGMWQITTKENPDDYAYTNLNLPSHNDNTYFTEAAGLQIFHCVEHDGTGGESTLVDGFYGANQLKKQSPEDYNFLTKFNVETEYLEEGHHHKYSAPIIRIDNETGDLVQIRFNVYDRTPMAFSNSKDCRLYYRALRKLAGYYEDITNQWRFKLRPGTVIAIDNFRLLHGRTAFTGIRVLAGSYVARSDWLDKARVLKLIE